MYCIILSRFARFFSFFGRGMEGNFGGDWAVELCSSRFAVEPEVQSIRNLLLKKPTPSLQWMFSSHLMKWSDTNTLALAPSLGLNVFFGMLYFLFEFIAFSQCLLQCKSSNVRLVYYPLLVIHGECISLNFHGVPDLSFLNKIVRLAYLRGV
jgi:hypothetical protein